MLFAACSRGMEYRITAIAEDGSETRLCTITVTAITDSGQSTLSNVCHDSDAVAAVPEGDRRAILRWVAMWLLGHEKVPEDMADVRLAADFYRALNEEYAAKVNTNGRLPVFDQQAFTAAADRLRRHGLTLPAS